MKLKLTRNERDMIHITALAVLAFTLIASTILAVVLMSKDAVSCWPS